MKFCPKCGNQLPDDARFCNKCGAPQPGFENQQTQVQPNPQPVVNTQPVNTQSVSKPSDRERFNNLMQNDDKFATIVRTSKRVNLLSLINLLFIVIWAVCLFTPIAMFTGVNVSNEGQTIMDNVIRGQFPYEFSTFSILELKNLAPGKTLVPGATIGPYAIVAFIFGFIFVALIVVFSVVGTTNGYMLKTYEAGKEAELIKTIKSPTRQFFGTFFALLPFMAMIVTYIGCTDVKYNYSDGKRYIYGEVVSLPKGLITCIVTYVICAAVMITLGFVLKAIVCKKLNRILKN